MIKAAGKTIDGYPLLVLGLSGENMTRLMYNEPIEFDVSELGLPPMTVVILGGSTEGSIKDQLINKGWLSE